MDLAKYRFLDECEFFEKKGKHLFQITFTQTYWFTQEVSEDTLFRGFITVPLSEEKELDYTLDVCIVGKDGYYKSRDTLKESQYPAWFSSLLEKTRKEIENSRRLRRIFK